MLRIKNFPFLLCLTLSYPAIAQTTITYDANHRVTSTNNPSAYQVTYQYDSTGNRILRDVFSNNPLPVTWLSFEVEPLETQESLLEWQTASEQNTTHFTVQHSTNAYDFDSVGIVQSVGNSSSVTDYSFTHDRPITGMNYYRLKQVDVNGEFDYSELRTAYFSALDQAELLLYPNPTDSKLKISLKGISYSDKIQFSVYDALGNLVKSNPVFSENVWEMDISHLTNGTYVLQVRYEHDSKRAKFVVVQKK